MRTEKDGANGEDTPEPRLVSTVRSPSAERTNGMQGQTLPIVEEVGEASSTGGRSGRSREVEHGEEERPRTPAKDYERRPVTPMKDHLGDRQSGEGLEKGVRKAVSRSSLDKKLPPLPKTESVNRKESILP
jgi:1-phosphatidylinositol-4-phosphate 5-kinase